MNTKEKDQNHDSPGLKDVSKLQNFSVFHAPITNIIPFKEVTISDVFKVIVSVKYKEVTNELRNSSATDAAKIKREKLDYACFSGKFSIRSGSGLIYHSGLLCIDLDHVSNIAEAKNKIIESLPPALLFTSPSGDGLKVIYKIDITQGTHIEYFLAFESFFKNEIGIEIDKSGKNIDRACFLCHDSEAYLNEAEQPLDRHFIDTFQPESGTPPRSGEIVNTLKIEYLKTWINKTETFINGNRNNYVSKLVGAFNRFGIPETLALNDVSCYARDGFDNKEIQSIVKSVYNNVSWYNTAKFDINTPYGFNEQKQQQNKPLDKIPMLPIDGMPEAVQYFVNEYTRVHNTPRDFIAASVLFAFALAIGDKLELVGKFKNVPILWIALIGNVSSGKTDPLNLVMKFFHALDNLDNERFLQEKIQFDENNDLPKKDREKLKLPIRKQYVLIDSTPEALTDAHQGNTRGLTYYRDELKGFFDDFNRYSKSGEQSNLLSSYFRVPYVSNRKGSGVLRIDQPCIYIAGGIQPDLLPSLASDNRAENGFLSRLCNVYPDDQRKPQYTDDKLNNDTIQDFYSYLNILVTLPETEELKLSGEASGIYSNWFNDNAEITNIEQSGYLKGVYGKLDVISLRLAIVLHGMNYACNQDTSIEISGETMRSAISLTEYFRATALKVYHKIFSGKSVELNKKDVIRYCKGLGASQNEIAAALKVSQQYVQKILIDK